MNVKPRRGIVNNKSFVDTRILIVIVMVAFLLVAIRIVR